MLPLVGFFNAFKEPLAASKSCDRICNELVADLTGISIEDRAEEGNITHVISCNDANFFDKC